MIISTQAAEALKKTLKKNEFYKVTEGQKGTSRVALGRGLTYTRFSVLRKEPFFLNLQDSLGKQTTGVKKTL